MIVVHATHEAVEKIGGIGAVIAGLVTTDAYRETVNRTVLVGPLLNSEPVGSKRLGPEGEVLYSSLDGIDVNGYEKTFRPVEMTYGVGIIYGKRRIEDPFGKAPTEVEVLLVDVFHFSSERINLFKAELFKKFGIPSHDFEKVWDYEQYVRLAQPAFDALTALGAHDDNQPIVYLSHEYMGMPLALKVVLDGPRQSRTVFYAHEVASVRPLVEEHPGHDVMFYNVLDNLAANGQILEDVFPEVRTNYKHPLVRASRYLDRIFAVGDFVEKELRVLDRHFAHQPINLVYNGIPAQSITPDQRSESRLRMLQYGQNLFGVEPNWIATHVARPVRSKACWRDLRVLHEMEPLLAERDEHLVYFLLGSLGGQRRPQDIRQMERVYGWPVHHEDGYPDLCGGEEILMDLFESYNRDHEHTRAVLVNQFGWSHELCGHRMPKDMTFADIRQGTDIEFGMSIYEPFGISQLEPLSFGAICVPSNVCGCMGFVRQVTGDKPAENVLEADFIDLGRDVSIDQAKAIGAAERDPVESTESRRLAEELIRRLPRQADAADALAAAGAALAGQMSWEHVVTDFLLPALRGAENETN